MAHSTHDSSNEEKQTPSDYPLDNEDSREYSRVSQHRHKERLFWGFLVICIIIVVACIWAFSKDDEGNPRYSLLLNHDSSTIFSTSPDIIVNPHNEERLEKEREERADNRYESRKEAIEDYFNQYKEQMKGDTAFAYKENDREAITRDADRQQKASSLITIYILAAYYQQIHDGKLNGTDVYTVNRQDQINRYNNQLYVYEAGTEFTLDQIAYAMIVYRDNYATDVMIDRLGGVDTIQHFMNDKGFSSIIQRKMTDNQAKEDGKDNYTNANDLIDFFDRLSKNELVGEDEDQEMLRLLKQPKSSYLNANGGMRNIVNASGHDDSGNIYNEALIYTDADGEDHLLVALVQNGDDQTSNQLASLGQGVATTITDSIQREQEEESSASSEQSQREEDFSSQYNH